MAPPVSFDRALPAGIVTEFSSGLRGRGKHEDQQEAEWGAHVDRLALSRERAPALFAPQPLFAFCGRAPARP